MLESLESRVVLYTATGNAWMNPAVVTISFMPDGTSLGGTPSNLISTFNNNPGLNGKWQNQILKAAQTWAQQTNLNFVVVPDDGVPSGAGNYQEGDPGMGDIRIGGYNFGNTTLACTYQPPPANNYSIAGDITFNTGMTFNIGQTYDLFTVAAHELGLALGLGESNSGSNAIMWPVYVGKKTALAADDIAGIQSIYSAGGPRTPDIYNGLNSSFTTAADITSAINGHAHLGVVPNLDIASARQAEFFTMTVPGWSSGTMIISAQSLGLSLLSPKLTVYAADQATVLGSANGAGQYGANLTVSVPNVTAGERFYVEVQGADTTAFGTGNYALDVSYNGAAPATEPSPIIAYANGYPLHSGGGSQAVGNNPDSSASMDVSIGVVLSSLLSATTVSTSSSSSSSSSSSIVISGSACDDYTVSSTFAYVLDDGSSTDSTD